MKTNALSALGRMSYATHLLCYPVIGSTGYFMYSAWSKSSSAKAKAIEIETMPKAKAVDPDNFNPFSAIPFHNNTELRYRYADMKMFGYLDKHTQINLKDYIHKSYHNSYDHNNNCQHLYNWVNTMPSHNA